MEWREVPGTVNTYRVSDTGEVEYLTPRGFLPMKQSPLSKRGYPSVSVDGRRQTVHRLMALAFLPNPQNFLQVRHLNDVPTDNRLENLAWGTEKQNAADRTRNGGGSFERAAAVATHCAKGLHERTPENLVTRTKSDGRTTETCKPCELERARAGYAKNAEKRRAYARQRIADETPEQRARRLAYQAEYRREHRQ